MTEPTSPSTAGGRPPRKIIVGVDGSDSAGYAAHWAAAEAGRRGATLTLVHALHLPGPSAAMFEPTDYVERRRAEARTLLDKQAAALRADHPGLPIAVELSDLDPAHTLATLGEAAELVVTGSRGRGGFSGMLLGSVTRRLAVHTPCPLVVVRAEPAPEPGDGKIVLGAGPEHSTANAARYAFETARRQHATLEVVRAYTANMIYTGMAGIGTMYEGHPEADRLDALESAKEAIAPLASEYPDVTVEVAAREGNPVTALIEAAREASLLVVATHRHRGTLAVGAGYVPDGVLAHSPVPVAVVPDR